MDTKKVCTSPQPEKIENHTSCTLTEEQRREKVRKISQMLLIKNKQAYSNLAKR